MAVSKYGAKGLRQVNVRTVGGKSITHFRLRHAGRTRCADCKAVLNGVIHSKKGSVSLRKPSRMHGGNLCTKCVRAVITSMVEGMIQ